MAGTTKAFDTPDATRTPDKTRVDVVDVGTRKVARQTFQPGWRWSECIGSLVGADRCQRSHYGVAVAGRLHVRGDDGSEIEIGPGEAYTIEPGHDGWVVGDEAFVSYEFDPETAEAFLRLPS